MRDVPSIRGLGLEVSLMIEQGSESGLGLGL